MTTGDIEPSGPGSSADDAFDVELAAASLRADTTDVSILLEALVRELGDALGERLTVQRGRGLRRRGAPVEALSIRLGDDELRAERQGPTVACTVGHTSGGIRIRTERVDMQQWLTRLLSRLRDEAAHSEATRRALEHIVIGGTS